MPKIPGRPAVLAATAALSLAVGVAGPPALAHQALASAGQWRIVQRGQGVGSAIIATTRASVWAFGTIGTPARFVAAARHWDGHRWSRASRVSARNNSFVLCAGSSPATNVWAFLQAGADGGEGPSYAAALRLRHGRWVTEKVLSSRLGTIMTGCNVLGPTDVDVWVFGGAVAGPAPTVGTWHLTRSGWRHLNTGNMIIFDASVVSATDIWGAAADVSASGPLPVLARWNGKHWTQNRSIQAALPKPTGKMSVDISAVHALSAHDVWVQAITSGQNRILGTVVVHWNGRTWHRVRRGSFGYHLPTAVSDGHGGWWTAPSPLMVSHYLLHGAHGHWTRFPMPHDVLVNTDSVSLSHVPHSGVMVADGLLVGKSGHFTRVVLASGPLPR